MRRFCTPCGLDKSSTSVTLAPRHQNIIWRAPDVEPFPWYRRRSAATVEKILFRISEQRIVKAISFDDFEMWFTRTVSANNMTLAFLRIAQELELFEQDDD